MEKFNDYWDVLPNKSNKIEKVNGLTCIVISCYQIAWFFFIVNKWRSVVEVYVISNFFFREKFGLFMKNHTKKC